MITPFRLAIPQSALDDLHRRLADTRWPDQPRPATPADGGWRLGPPVEELRELAEYWRTGYDWRAAEAQINSFPQFTTEIDGQNVHFLHVRSVEPDARPLILTHGWPGSIVEYLDLIGPLVNPVAHGGDATDAFHVVLPSLPGYGLSGPTTETGWDQFRVARAWAELMSRLGYDRYLAHGGDWGSAITRELGVADPEHLVALHVLQIFSASISGKDADLSDPEERHSVETGRRYRAELGGYSALQSTRPQLISYALTDSPVGQLAWIVDAFHHWTGNPVGRDALLTNVMLYWLTGTAGSSARYYYDGYQNFRHALAENTVPTAVAVFAHDIAAPVRRVAEKSNNIVRWKTYEQGGHFASLEQPELVLTDIRESFRPFTGMNPTSA
ncbi:epoxide hydrolase family protein [Pseudonocardia spinosispora]|uniref:epoxide hydrolase family protein n=1 Tax=Pseudonocardia spinosispora TaxID=103441 RepID=UPI00041AE813|nr:epoxide hydrolase family protein [Pseudonocardia spinosispora]